MNNTDLRFFLAHDKSTDDETIDLWVERCTEVLNDYYEDREVTVVSGRDDYQRRAKEAGGWKGWNRSVVSGTLFDGSQLFHGIIRPGTPSMGCNQVVGRATYDMVTGMIALGKTAWVWFPEDGQFVAVDAFCRLEDDSWVRYGELLVTLDD